MKVRRLLCMLLCLCLLPVLAAAEETPAARELDVQATENSKAMDTAALRDGSDSTLHVCKYGKSVTISVVLGEGDACSQVYLRLNASPTKATIRRRNGNRWEEAASIAEPGAEFVLAMGTPVTEQMQLLLDFSGAVSAGISELRFFEAGPLPAQLHVWAQTGTCDILLVAENAAQVDADAVAHWVSQGRSVACALLTQPEEGLLEISDSLWAAGVRRKPICLALAAQAEGVTEAALDKAWPDKFLMVPLVSAVRAVSPMTLVISGAPGREDWLYDKAQTAVSNAQEATYQTADAEANGIWVTPHVFTIDNPRLDDNLLDWEERTDAYLRQLCWRQYDGAVYTDPSVIPYPDNRLADGYLPEGEFLFEDADNGVWAYLSPTVQVEIVRYEKPELPQVWFVTDLHFKPEAESFGQVLYASASFKNQQIYPETLAQDSNLVLAVNGDYYPYRVERKTGIGNILRAREVLYDYNPNKRMAYPNLDTMALRDDGTLTVYAASEITATELLAQGDVHDALSFGPYLARDGKIRIYSGEGCEATEPRNAVGMVSAGHYKIITVEGRINPGPKGVTLNVLSEMMYAQGVTDAFNLDGGSTSVLIFMGTKLNRTGANTGRGLGSPRNMHELFGVGTSPLTHTDMLNRK